jgi:hypothetical protein
MKMLRQSPMCVHDGDFMNMLRQSPMCVHDGAGKSAIYYPHHEGA